LGSGGSKKNVLTTKNPPVFHLNFQKGLNMHLITPILSANKKLWGFKHAHLKQRGEKAFLGTFWT
jgi:hypothetical protein